MEHQPTESQTMMFCHGCAKPLHVSALACPSCGAPQRKRAESTVSESEKSKVTAGVLALLLGGLGIHKFYTGAWGWGIVYIVLCWTYVPALVALGEGIRYLVLSKEEFARKAAVMKGPFAWLW